MVKKAGNMSKAQTGKYVSVWEQMRRKAASEERAAVQAAKEAANANKTKVTQAMVAQRRGAAAKWWSDFHDYNASLGNALGQLAEQPQDIQGRDKELALLSAILERPITPVALLLGEAGAGKTALVEEFVKQANSGRLANKTGYHYMLMALRLGELSALDSNKLQAALATLFGRLKEFEDRARKALGDDNVRIVLFIDEVHMMVTIFGPGTKIGGDVLKDMLARAPIRVVAATTRREYDSTIAVDKPLAERFKQMELNQVSSEIVKDIALNWWEKVAPDCPPIDEDVIAYVINANKSYRPDSAEPRKTLDTLEDLVSHCRRTGEPATKQAVVEVFHNRFSIELGFNIDADKVYAEIARRIKGQPAALHVWNLLLHATAFKVESNANKPIFTALLTGSTGTGKRLPDTVRVPVFTADNETCWKLNGELEVGDKVFNRYGKPVSIVDVFHSEESDMYEIEFADGRKIEADAEHLWSYKSRNGNGAKYWKTANTKELWEKLRDAGTPKNGRTVKEIKFVIPMNGAVEWPAREYATDPYVIGAWLGDGCKGSAFNLSGADDEVMDEVSALLGADGVYAKELNYSHCFLLPEKEAEEKSRERHASVKYFQTADVLCEIPEVCDKYAYEKFIPRIYKTGSVEQRWHLIQGLFDTDGTISSTGGRFNVSYTTTSKKLAEDVQEVLWSLGISSRITSYERPGGKHIEYRVHVRCNAEDKKNFFRLTRKLKWCEQAEASVAGKQRVKRFGEVLGIRDIRKLKKSVPATCILVDDDEHLYQAGDFIVTHNTESVKAISQSLYPGQNVIRVFNMPDYSLPSMEPQFRKELGETLRHTPNAVLLLDEFEKGAPNIKMSMLQILDEGLVNFTVLNREGREETNTASMRDAIVIATTNSGASVFADDQKYNRPGTGTKKDEYDYVERAQVDRLLVNLKENLMANGYPPEMLGRFDQIVPYRALSENASLEILTEKLNELVEGMRVQHDIEILVNPPVQWSPQQYDCVASDVVVYIAFERAKIRESNSGGARALMRELDAGVFYQIVQALVDNPGRKRFRLRVDGVESQKMPGNGTIYRMNTESNGGVIVEPV